MNSKNSNYTRADHLETATSAMRAIRVTEIPHGVREATRLEMTRASRNRRLRNRPVQGVALAAIALMIIGLVVVPVLMRSTPAVADVVREMEATTSLRARVVDPHEGGTMILSGARSRFESENAVAITDLTTGDELMLDMRSKTAYRIYGRQPSRAIDVYQIIRRLAQDASKPTKDYIDNDGRRFPGFSGESSLNFGDDASLKVHVTVWNDSTTKLPVRMKIRSAHDNEMDMLLDKIEFDVPVEKGTFDMTIPADYTVASLSPDKLGPPPGEQDAARLVIVPGVGLGDIRFGMSRGQITAVFGEPESTLHNIYLNYASKGVQLVLVGREPDKLGMIIANPVDAASLTRHDFRGRTDKGIRMGSTSQQIRDAYGEPDQPANPNQMSYRDLGITFILVNGKAGQIIASRTQ